MAFFHTKFTSFGLRVCNFDCSAFSASIFPRSRINKMFNFVETTTREVNTTSITKSMLHLSNRLKLHCKRAGRQACVPTSASMHSFEYNHKIEMLIMMIPNAHSNRLLNRWTIKIWFSHTFVASIRSCSPIYSWFVLPLLIFYLSWAHYFWTEMCAPNRARIRFEMRWLVWLFFLVAAASFESQIDLEWAIQISCDHKLPCAYAYFIVSFVLFWMHAYSRVPRQSGSVRVCGSKWCDSSKWRFCVYITSNH